jgi:hypothetical protein
MLQSMTWFATDNLARSQFELFSEIGEQMKLSDSFRPCCAVLAVRATDWQHSRTALLGRHSSSSPSLLGCRHASDIRADQV